MFPISIEQSVNGNLDVSIEGRGSEEEEEEDWVLSGVSTPCITPLAHICHGFLPANGDMAGYIDMGMKFISLLYIVLLTHFVHNSEEEKERNSPIARYCCMSRLTTI